VSRDEAIDPAASPRPWTIDDREEPDGVVIRDANENPIAACPDCGVRASFDIADAEMIVSLVNGFRRRTSTRSTAR